MLRLLRAPGTRGPAPLTRLLAVVVLIAMVGVSAPILLRAAGWVLEQL